MADTVQRAMEAMLPELEDLMERQIFTQAEVKSIIQRRRKFEYQMGRRALKRVDVLRYITYELNLDQLRQLRKKDLGARKTSVSDYAGTRRIHQIYNRALFRLNADSRLWMQYLDFCVQTKSGKLVSKTFSRALQMHSQNVVLWLRAATWEFQKNANIDSARMLMQRALRTIKGRRSKELYIEYFRLEMQNTLKIIQRRQILGLDDGTKKSADVVATDDSEATGMIQLEKKQKPSNEDEEEEDEEEVDAPPEVDEGARQQFLRGIVPLIVFNEAATKVPRSVRTRDFFESFLAIAEEYPEPMSSNVCKAVQDKMLQPTELGLDAEVVVAAIERPLQVLLRRVGRAEQAAAFQERKKRRQAGADEAVTVAPTVSLAHWVPQIMKQEAEATKQIEQMLATVQERADTQSNRNYATMYSQIWQHYVDFYRRCISCSVGGLDGARAEAEGQPTTHGRLQRLCEELRGLLERAEEEQEDADVESKAIAIIQEGRGRDQGQLQGRVIMSSPMYECWLDLLQNFSAEQGSDSSNRSWWEVAIRGTRRHPLAVSLWQRMLTAACRSHGLANLRLNGVSDSLAIHNDSSSFSQVPSPVELFETALSAMSSTALSGADEVGKHSDDQREDGTYVLAATTGRNRLQKTLQIKGLLVVWCQFLDYLVAHCTVGGEDGSSEESGEDVEDSGSARTVEDAFRRVLQLCAATRDCANVSDGLTKLAQSTSDGEVHKSAESLLRSNTFYEGIWSVDGEDDEDEGDADEDEDDEDEEEEDEEEEDDDDGEVEDTEETKYKVGEGEEVEE
jgi:hypothetical protein